MDDKEGLTELYALILEASGYKVRAFNDRLAAIAAIKLETNKPDLLITDYFGLSMPAGQFIDTCRLVHPRLKILMASGYSPSDARFSSVTPNRYLRKPFTPQEFLHEIRTTLDGPGETAPSFALQGHKSV